MKDQIKTCSYSGERSLFQQRLFLFFKVLIFSILANTIVFNAYAVDSDSDGLDSSIETCDGNFVPGVNAGTCDTTASCDANPGCYAVKDYDGDGDLDGFEFNVLGNDPSTDDTDGDGLLNTLDNCHRIANSDQADGDNDGVGDVCDGDFVDTDMDGIKDYYDNCVDDSNSGQEDGDNDGIGDVCDADAFDTDEDTILDYYDNCINDPNPGQEDADNDGVGDTCDGDVLDNDADGVVNSSDNCIDYPNPSQGDADNDGVGDFCDPDGDPDGDGLDNSYENSIGTDIASPDTDQDGVSDGTEDANGTNPLNGDTDGDGVSDSADMFPNDRTQIIACIPGDANGDGLVNAADVMLVQQRALGYEYSCTQ